ncbi:hypothetical protein ADL28_44375 [Streptomyces violaceusniger]|uniref:Uncharacterized protein n=1 Tax=Streptomyces violaceusniger TaxID=68280 RepID=A0A0X3VE16_STRVO|nr:hypothetical protein ADL28_44375 [Streptomyces violaceusniger]
MQMLLVGDFYQSVDQLGCEGVTDAVALHRGLGDATGWRVAVRTDFDSAGIEHVHTPSRQRVWSLHTLAQ